MVAVFFYVRIVAHINIVKRNLLGELGEVPQLHTAILTSCNHVPLDRQFCRFLGGGGGVEYELKAGLLT